MKNPPTSVPAILEHLNPVTEQFGPVSHNTDQMQIPATAKDARRFLYQLLTASEQAVCDAATD